MKPETPFRGCRTTKIYCRPGCPPGRRTKPENRVYFGSRNEARVKGYRACKVCRPDDSFKVKEPFFFNRYTGLLGTYIIMRSEKGLVFLKPEEQVPKIVANNMMFSIP